MEYWCGLPEEHHGALFQLREEDFAAELDAHLKYQLRICRDCRGNVYRAYRCVFFIFVLGTTYSAQCRRWAMSLTSALCQSINVKSF